ncbi:MAG: hypothetical protein AAF649_09595 [Verrucomicrobiota bacterium]
MAIAEPQEKKNTGKVGGASRMMTSMAFMVSVVVHLVIFLFVGSVVIFEGAIPPNLFTSVGGDMVNEEVADEMELPPLMEEEIEPELLETPMEELELETEMDLTDAMNSSDLIISNAPTPMLTQSFPKPTLSVGTETGTKLFSGAKSSNKGVSRGPGSPRTANIFGKTVSASNFGAILDISYSTHKTINVAVNEIKSGFPDATLVLVPGCGVKESQSGSVIKGMAFEKNIKDYHVDGRERDTRYYYAAAFFEKLIDENKDFKRLWDRAVRDDRGYVLHLDLPATASDGSTARTAGTQHALKFLIDQGCDVIYWMADFNDTINTQMAKDLVKEMKRADSKLIQHDFDGASNKDKKNRALMKSMVNDTDGQQIIGAK